MADVAELYFAADSRPLLAVDDALDKVAASAKTTETATQRMNRQFEAQQKLLSTMSGGLNKLDTSVERLVADMQSLAKAQQEANKYLSSMARSMENTAAATNRLDTSMDKLSKSTKVAGNVVRQSLAGFGVATLLAGGAKAIKDFEAELSGLQAVLGDQGIPANMEKLRDVAKELGATTRYSAGEAAEGMTLLAQAGFDTVKIVETMPSVLNLATAAQVSLGQAAEITGGIMAAFNLDASKAAMITDVLATASAASNTDVAGLGEAMKYVGSVAGTLGISIQETAAAVGVLSNANIKGSSAGTGLRRVLSTLVAPTKMAREALEGLGVSMESIDPQTNSLADILTVLQKSGLDASSALEIFGDVGGTALLTLMDKVPGLQALNKTINESEGSAKKMAEVYADNLKGGIDGASSAFENLAIKLGEGGLLKVMKGFISALTDSLNLLAKYSDELVLAAEVAGAYLLVFVALPAAYVAATGAAATFLLTLTSMNAALGVAVAELGLLKAAAFVVAAAFAGWEIGTWLRENFVEARVAGLAFVEAILVGWELIKAAGKIMWEGLKEAAIGTLNIIRERFAALFQGISDVAGVAGLDGLSASMGELAASFRPASSAAEDFAGNVKRIAAESKANIKAIQENTRGLMEYEVAQDKANKAVKEAAPAAVARTEQEKLFAQLMEGNKKLLDGVAADEKQRNEERAAAAAKAADASKKRQEAAQKANETAAAGAKEAEIQIALMKDGVAADEAAAIAKARVSGASEELALKLVRLQKETQKLTEKQKKLDEVLVMDVNAFIDKAVDPIIDSDAAEVSSRVAEDMKDAADQSKIVADNLGKKLGNEFNGDRIKQSISDAILRGGLDSVGDLIDLIGNSLKATTFQIVLDPLMDSIGESINGAFEKGAELLGKDSAVLKKQLGTAVAAFGIGKTVGGFLEGKGPFGKNTGNLVGAGAAIGSFAGPVGAVVGGVVGALASGIIGSWKTKSKTVALAFTDGFVDATITEVRKKKSLVGGKKKTNIDDALGLDEALGDAFGSLYSAVTTGADALGLAVGSFSFKITESIKGLEGAELDAKIQEIFGKATDALVSQVIPSIAAFAAEGETLGQTFDRIVGETLATKEALSALGGQTQILSGLAGIELTQALVAAAGGFEQLQGALGFFFDKFYSDSEKLALTTARTTEGFAALGVALPTTRDEFKALVNSIVVIDDATANLYAGLLSLAPGIDAMYPAAEKAADGLGKVTDAMKDLAAIAEFNSGIQQQIDDFSLEGLDAEIRALDRQFDELRASAAEANNSTGVELVNALYALKRGALETAAATSQAASQMAAAARAADYNASIQVRIQQATLKGADLELYNLQQQQKRELDAAKEAGGDVTEVERLFAIERVRIVAEAAEQAAKQAQQEAARAAEERQRAADAASKKAADAARKRAEEIEAAQEKAAEAAQKFKDSINDVRVSLQKAKDNIRDVIASTSELDYAMRRLSGSNTAQDLLDNVGKLQSALETELSRQISAVEKNTETRRSALEKEKQALEEQLQSVLRMRDAAKSLREYVAGMGSSGTGGPAEALRVAQQELFRTANLARTGDEEATGKLTGIADRVLSGLEATAATRQELERGRASVASVLSGVAGAIENLQSPEEAAITKLDKEIAGLDESQRLQIAALNVGFNNQLNILIQGVNKLEALGSAAKSSDIVALGNYLASAISGGKVVGEMSLGGTSNVTPIIRREPTVVAGEGGELDGDQDAFEQKVYDALFAIAKYTQRTADTLEDSSNGRKPLKTTIIQDTNNPVINVEIAA